MLTKKNNIGGNIMRIIGDGFIIVILTRLRNYLYLLMNTFNKNPEEKDNQSGQLPTWLPEKPEEIARIREISEQVNKTALSPVNLDLKTEKQKSENHFPTWLTPEHLKTIQTNNVPRKLTVAEINDLNPGDIIFKTDGSALKVTNIIYGTDNQFPSLIEVEATNFIDGKVVIMKASALDFTKWEVKEIKKA